MTGDHLAEELLAWIEAEMAQARLAARQSVGPLFTASAASRLVAFGQVAERIRGQLPHTPHLSDCQACNALARVREAAQ